MENTIAIEYTTNEGSTRFCLPSSEKAKALHTCPFSEEIYYDNISLCDCTEEETNNCAMDI